MTSKKWYAKNNTLISLCVRTLMICLYVGMYSNPTAAGIAVIIVQSLYTIYFVLLIRFTKIRFFVFKIISHLLLIVSLVISYVGSVSDIGGSTWNSSSLVFIIFLVGHVIFYFLITVAEIIVNRHRILKYLGSFYSRFILCERLD